MATSPHEGTIEALVAGGSDYGEADRVVLLLTRTGRLSVFAPAAKKSRRRFQGALEPFTTISASLSSSKRRPGGMLTMTQAVVESSRLGLRSDLEKIALASYVVELGTRVAPENEPCDAMFDLVSSTLDHLLSNAASTRVRRAFELRLLAELGYTPHLDQCLECGIVPDRIFLDLIRGGVRCESHREGSLEIGTKTLAWLRAVLGPEEGFDPDAGFESDWSGRAARALETPVSEFYGSLIDRPLKALRMLEELGI